MSELDKANIFDFGAFLARIEKQENGDSDVPFKDTLTLGKPTIKLSTNLDCDLDASQEELAASPLVEVYQRGGVIVARGATRGKSHTGEDITYDSIAQHMAASLRPVLAEAAYFQKFSPQKKKFVSCYPPKELAELLVARHDKRYPVLRAIISTPTLRANGSILDKPGYDAETGLYFDPKGVVFGNIQDNPTRDDAVAALDLLKGILATFPFVDEDSRSTALARILTGLVRPSLHAAPMFGVTAPAARTGKSKIIDIACAIAHGHAAPVLAASSTPEELDKQLAALVGNGAATIAIDNLEPGVPIRSNLLCQMLTQSMVEIRPMGQNTAMRQYPSLTTISCNGNNMAVGADLTERTLLCSLDARVEFPGNRKFGFDPVERALESRVDLVRASLVLLRAHALAGYPGSAGILGGFEDWVRTVRNALMWLDCADPCGTMEGLRSKDPERDAKTELMEVWEGIFGNSYVSVAEVIVRAREYSNEEPTVRLLDALENVVPGKGNLNRELGHWLVKQEGAVLGGRKFVSTSDKKHARKYQLRSR
jgi:hypothetical protein